jgi:GAF domain-containing protein
MFNHLYQNKILCAFEHRLALKIDLTGHLDLAHLAREGVLTLEDFDVEPERASPLLTHSVERDGDLTRLIVDHSYFTAKGTIFSVHARDADEVVPRILSAVQDAVIAVQTKTVEMLASVNAAVINSLDDNEIVHSVLLEVMNVLPHSDAGVFRLFDEQSCYLVPVSHQGLSDDYTHYRLQPNESVSGEVFVTGVPAIHNGRQNIIDAHRVMRPESQLYMERSQIANALLCVPVTAEGKRLGTLTTLCFSPEGAFSVFDRTVLESLASQVAVAYQRSLAYQNALATSSRLERMRVDLEGKNAELDRAVEMHGKFLRIFSTGGSLAEQLDMVANLLNVDFRFENVLGLDYRSSGWTEQGKTIEQSVRVAEVPIGAFHFRAVKDVNFQRALFGTLAAFIALDFVRDMSRLDVLNASKRAYFDDLIGGAESNARRKNFAFRLERFYQIMVIKLPALFSIDTRLSLHRAQANIQGAIKLPNSLIFHEEDQIVMFFSTSSVAALERNSGTVKELASDLDIHVGASVIYDSAEFHSDAKTQAQRAAECLVRRGLHGMLAHRDMGIEVLLAGRNRVEVLAFAREILGPLLNDPKHHVLYETLSRYLQEARSATRTAASLRIHSNTFYQRLARIEALTGRNIAMADDFTLLSVACQLYSAYSSEAN